MGKHVDTTRLVDTPAPCAERHARFYGFSANHRM